MKKAFICVAALIVLASTVAMADQSDTKVIRLLGDNFNTPGGIAARQYVKDTVAAIKGAKTLPEKIAAKKAWKDIRKNIDAARAK